jgi:hypothetical protein
MSQQNQSTLQSAINTQLADNTSGAISAADVRDNLINMTDSLLFNSGSQGITGSLTATSFIGSLEGTATTASYVETAQTASYVLNAVSASRAATASISTFANSSNNILHADLNSNGDYAITFTSGIGYATVLCRLNQATGLSPFTYNPSTSLLKITGSIIATGGFTGSLLGTATTASYVETAQTASYVETAQTASYFSGTVNNAVSSSFSTTTNNIFLADTTGLLGIDYPIVIASQNVNNYVNTYGDTSLLTYNPIDSTLKSYVKFEQGYFPTATGNYSHAEGFSTRTTNQYAHAEGYRTLASGESSHSEGFFTTSSGNYSHAEGYLTRATGTTSHAEGYLTTASGDSSHAEGASNKALGIYSHAEGGSSVALGDYSHAEGIGVYANGNYSHAEGNGSIANGVNSHAEGQNTIAQGNGSHAEGVSTTSVGPFSHAEGVGTIASGSGQHVSGHYNTQGDNTSLFIIGNGDVNTEVRSDAFKVRMSGSIVLPTTQSAAPSWTGTDGEIVPATVGGEYFLYMWMGGAWRSGSFV